MAINGLPISAARPESARNSPARTRLGARTSPVHPRPTLGRWPLRSEVRWRSDIQLRHRKIRRHLRARPRPRLGFAREAAFRRLGRCTAIQRCMAQKSLRASNGHLPEQARAPAAATSLEEYRPRLRHHSARKKPMKQIERQRRQRRPSPLSPVDLPLAGYAFPLLVVSALSEAVSTMTPRRQSAWHGAQLPSPFPSQLGLPFSAGLAGSPLLRPSASANAASGCAPMTL